MRAMILAAGRGQRLSPLTDTTPKPLIKVGGEALIEHQLSALRTAGFCEVVINTGWLGQQLIEYLGQGSRYGLRIEYSIEPQTGLETGGGIYQALPLLGEQPFLVVNADIFHQIPFAGLRNQAELMSKQTLVHLLLVNNPDYHLEGDFCLDNNMLKEKKKDQSLGLGQQTFTYSGIGIYRPELFRDSSAGSFSSVPLIRSAITASKATGEFVDAAWFDAGTTERLETIERFIRPK